VKSEEQDELLRYLLEDEGLADEAAPALQRRADPGQRPLSFAQQRLWFLDQLEPGGTSYNMPGALRLRGKLDAAALARSLREIVARHEALRTTFTQVGPEPEQVVAPALDVPLPLIDLGHVPAGEREAAAWERIRAEADFSFDLRRGPLLRTTLLRLRADEHLLVVTLHHIVSDGWSMGVFVAELRALYAAFVAGRPSPLPAPPLQYADYAAWQRRLLQGESLERLLDYWRAHLAGAPERLELPADHPRPPVQTFRGTVLTFDLPAEVTRALRAFCQATQATPFMVLLLAWKTLLLRLTGETRLVVASSIAGRTRPEIEGLIGFFVNLLPLHTDLGGDPTFRQALERVRAATLGAYDHQELPFDRLVEDLKPHRDLAYSPICQVFFALQNAPQPDLRLPGLELELVDVPRVTAKYDLYLSLEPRGETLHGELEYSSDLFDPATVERWAGHYRSLLAAALARPETPLSGLPLVSDEQRRSTLAAGHGPRRDWADEGWLHEIFAARASLTTWPPCAATRRSPSASWSAAPTAWRGGCRPWASAPRRRSGWRSSARSTPSSRCSASGRPGARTCRSIPPIRPRTSTSSCATRGHACWSRARDWPGACRPSRARPSSWTRTRSSCWRAQTRRRPAACAPTTWRS
jgi:hypothetical protein